MGNGAVRPENTTVVICCAGMGTRLGIGTTKALVNICGKTLIGRQLELLKDYDDIRIVVGFQAEHVIEEVNQYRNDIMFVFNHQYETTGVADSLRKAIVGARDYIVSIDGDVLENPEDFRAFLASDKECIVLSQITSTESVKAVKQGEEVTLLSRTEGNWQWPGIAKISRNKITAGSAHVYGVLNEVLPIYAFPVRTREINTQDDYDKAIEWVENGMQD